MPYAVAMHACQYLLNIFRSCSFAVRPFGARFLYCSVLFRNRISGVRRWQVGRVE